MWTSEVDRSKSRAAAAAAKLIESGMTIGLGSGSTAALFLQALGERVRREGLAVRGVASSEGSAEIARTEGIEVVDLDSVDRLDIDVDGADEVDPEFRMIKGRGGALLREKIVAVSSAVRIFIVSPEKRVAKLGIGAPVPVEVTPFGLAHTERGIRALGATTRIRVDSSGTPFVTDEGHRILDCQFHGGIDDPVGLDRRLKSVVGVFETGLFLDLCDTLIVGHPDGVDVCEARPKGLRQPSDQ